MNDGLHATVVQSNDHHQLRVVLVNHNSFPVRVFVPNPYTNVTLVDLNEKVIPRSVVATWECDDQLISVAPKANIVFVLQLPFWHDVKEWVYAKCAIKIETSLDCSEELIAEGVIHLNIPSLEERLIEATKMKKQGIDPRGTLNVSRFVKVEI